MGFPPTGGQFYTADPRAAFALVDRQFVLPEDNDDAVGELTPVQTW